MTNSALSTMPMAMRAHMCKRALCSKTVFDSCSFQGRNNASNDLWLDTAQSGENDTALRSLLVSIRTSSAFEHLSMRAPTYSNFNGGDVYGMFCYDAFCTGDLQEAVSNLAS